MRRALEPLGGEAASRYVRVCVGDDAAVAPAALLREVIFASGVERGPFAHLPGLPTTVEDIAGALMPVAVSGERMLSLLVSLCTEDRAYGEPFGPWTPDGARDVLGCVVEVLGVEARWWANVDYPGSAWESGEFSSGHMSNPVTGYTVDCAVVGVGRDLTLTVLAFAES